MIEKEKEIELLNSVMELFMKYGIKSLTMDDITRHLGISKKTLYLYVKDKKDLVCKGTQLMIDEEQKYTLELADSSENAIDELIELTTSVNSKFGEMHPSVIYDLQKYHPKAWKVIEDHKQGFVYNIMLKNLQRGIKEGFYRKNLNPQVIAFVYISMLDNIFNADSQISSSMSIEKLYLEIVNYHIKGIANEQGVAYLKIALKKEKNKKLSID